MISVGYISCRNEWTVQQFKPFLCMQLVCKENKHKGQIDHFDYIFPGTININLLLSVVEIECYLFSGAIRSVYFHADRSYRLYPIRKRI